MMFIMRRARVVVSLSNTTVECNHGSWSSTQNTCICDDGWSTSVHQDVLSGYIDYCNSLAVTPNNTDTSAATVATVWSTATILLLGGAILVAIALVLLVYCCCCKKRCKSKDRESGSQQRELQRQFFAMQHQMTISQELAARRTEEMLEQVRDIGMRAATAASSHQGGSSFSSPHVLGWRLPPMEYEAIPSPTNGGYNCGAGMPMPYYMHEPYFSSCSVGRASDTEPVPDGRLRSPRQGMNHNIFSPPLAASPRW